MPPASQPRSGRCIALVALVLSVSALAVRGQEQRVEITRNGLTTTLVLPEYKSQGIPYASMADIARQLDGSVEVDAARAAMLINGLRAEVGLNDVTVQRGEQSFTLLHPVLGYQDDALIAMSDVVRMLRDGFGMGTPDTPPMESALALPPAEPVPAPAETSLDALEETPLESINPDPLALEDAPLESVLPAETVRAQALEGPAFANTANIVVAIDPGHGGEDAGIAGTNGLMEKDLCLAVSVALRRLLKENYGIATVITREGDEALSAQSRLDAVSNGNASLVVSIHGGASYATGASGPAVFAHVTERRLSTDPRPGLKVAHALAGSLESVSPTGSLPVREASLALLQGSKVPGVLVELGNVANPGEAARLADPQYQEQMAAALAAGLNRALGRPEPAGTVQ